jgi:hypothetical protein
VGFAVTEPSAAGTRATSHWGTAQAYAATDPALTGQKVQAADVTVAPGGT